MTRRILVRGPVNTLTGYGQDVVGLLRALLEAGVDVDLWPLDVVPPIPEPVAALLTRPLKPPYDVLLWYGTPSQITPWELPGWGEKVLGWTMWESTPLHGTDLSWWDPEHPELAGGRVWSRRSRSMGDVPKAWLDRLLVTCPMNIDAFAAVDPHLPIDVLTPGLRLKDWPELDRPRDPGAPVVFGCEGVLSGRKDPGTLFEAWDLFRAAHPDVSARLELHVSGNPREALARAAARPAGDVTVHVESWSHQQMLEWYQGIDCWVSTSRGEGVNKPAVQALATGIPVIAAAWGGHETWMHQDHSWAVDYTPVDTDDGKATQVLVDAGSVAEAMGKAATDPEVRRRKGRAGAAFVASSFGWDRQVAELLRLAAR